MIKKIVYERFGSKWGLLNYSKYYLRQAFGVYARYRNVEWSRVDKLIFICKGNICRSPWGEGYARHFGICTESYGTDCANDHAADPRAIAYAKSVGIDLSSHRTRHIRALIPQASDLLVVMEPDHLVAVAQFADVAQITLAGLWLPRPTPYIHDPYSSKIEYFHRCEALIAQSINRMRDNLTSN
jgi:protein-tyrosine phosphatase